MKSFKIVILVFALSLVVVVKADEPPTIEQQKLAAIKQLMAITGATSNSAQFSAAFSQQMVSILRQSNPSISRQGINIVYDEVGKIVAEEFAAESLQSQIYPIYAHHFNLEEIQLLIKFNQSKVGKKANKIMPRLVEESVAAAQSWSQQVGPKISTRVSERLLEAGIPIQNNVVVQTEE